LGLIYTTGTITSLLRQGQIFFIVFQFGVHTNDHRQGRTLKYAQNKEHLTGFASNVIILIVWLRPYKCIAGILQFSVKGKSVAWCCSNSYPAWNVELHTPSGCCLSRRETWLV